MFAVAPSPQSHRRFDFQLASLLEERAGGWFAPFTTAEPATARILCWRKRRVCSLYRLETVVNGQRHRVWAKQYHDWRESSGEMRPNRPAPIRLFPPPKNAEKAPFEFAALGAIYDHFSGLSDPRFSAIRPLLA